MLAYRYDEQGLYVGTFEFDPDDALPPRSTSLPPPPVEGKVVCWAGGRWELIPRAPLPPSPHWPTFISTRRYKSETSGITLSSMPMPMPIATDRDSQGLITGAAVAALLDSDYSLNWKTSAGFIKLSAVQILSLASAVRAHVQASFDREAQLLAAVADGSITAAMLEEGWPA